MCNICMLLGSRLVYGKNYIKKSPANNEIEIHTIFYWHLPDVTMTD